MLNTAITSLIGEDDNAQTVSLEIGDIGKLHIAEIFQTSGFVDWKKAKEIAAAIDDQILVDNPDSLETNLKSRGGSIGISFNYGNYISVLPNEDNTEPIALLVTSPELLLATCSTLKLAPKRYGAKNELQALPNTFCEKNEYGGNLTHVFERQIRDFEENLPNIPINIFTFNS